MNRFADFHHTKPKLGTACLALCIGIFSWLPLTTHAATSAQQLIDKAHSFLEQEVATYKQQGNIQARHEINIGRLDSRLRMNPCNQELDARLESPPPPIGRVTVRISCGGDAPWSIFVPANISMYRQVVTASRPVKRNELLQAGDLALAERDLANLSQGYFTELEQVDGSQARRALQPDQVIAPANIQLPPMIKRGDQVVIIANSGSIKVKMPGEALSDGAFGQQIRVRNTRSQRIVHARVIAPGQVEVAM